MVPLHTYDTRSRNAAPILPRVSSTLDIRLSDHLYSVEVTRSDFYVVVSNHRLAVSANTVAYVAP